MGRPHFGQSRGRSSPPATRRSAQLGAWGLGGLRNAKCRLAFSRDFVLERDENRPKLSKVARLGIGNVLNQPQHELEGVQGERTLAASLAVSWINRRS